MNEDMLKSKVRNILKEIAIVISYITIAVVIGFILNIAFKGINKPPIVSNDNQRTYTQEVLKRMDNSPQQYFGDLKLEYLGSYKYDNEITSISQLDEINHTRKYILDNKSYSYSRITAWILLSALILFRYISKLIKWLS